MRLHAGVVGVVARALPDREEVQVVVQVRSHPRQIVDDRNPHLLQVLRGTDPGMQQELRRPDGAAGDDDLPLRAKRLDASPDGHLHARRAAFFNEDAKHAGAGADLQIAPAPVGGEVGGGRRRAPGVALGELVVAHPFLPGAVEVRVEGDPQRLRRLEPGFADGQGRNRLGDPERPPFGVVGVEKALVVLRALETGEHLPVGPALAALPCPPVVVGRVAAGIDLRVDGRSAAQHPGLGIAQDAAVQMPLRHGGPAPGGDAPGHPGEAGGHVDERMPVRSARLDQGDRDARVLREPSGHHASGRPGAHDHVVAHRAAPVRPGFVTVTIGMPIRRTPSGGGGFRRCAAYGRPVPRPTLVTAAGGWFTRRAPCDGCDRRRAGPARPPSGPG